MKNALIIGGSGGLSSVVARLAQKDYTVWVLTRGRRELPDGVIPLVADRNDYDAFSKAILSANVTWDVVFDCICMNKENASDDLTLLGNLTRRLIVISTDSVYDPLHKKTPQNEDGVFIEEEGTTSDVSYGCNKRRMEVRFLEYMNSADSSMKITIFRPGHIYGPGFLLGCFPENSRRADLIDQILAGYPMNLVGLGTYLVQPIYVDDLAKAMIDSVEKEGAFNQIFCIGGPEAVENRYYYECIGKALNKEVIIHEVPLEGYLEAHPEYSGHLCHRIYDLSKLKNAGICLPDTHIEEGIKRHVEYLLKNDKF